MTSSVSSAPPISREAGGLELAAECRVFTRYLIGQDPDSYVVSRYQDGHRAIPYRVTGPRLPLDAALVMFASRGPMRTRVADAYARIFRPHGALRQKLTLLLAVLENAPSTHRRFTSGGTGPARALFQVTGALLGFGFALIAGILLLGPIHLVLGRAGRR